MLCDTVDNCSARWIAMCHLLRIVTRLSRNKRLKNINKVNDLTSFFFQTDAAYEWIIHHKRIVTCPKSRPNFQPKPN